MHQMVYKHNLPLLQQHQKINKNANHNKAQEQLSPGLNYIFSFLSPQNTVFPYVLINK